MAKEEKPKKKEGPSPAEIAAKAKGYEECALFIQDLYAGGERVSEAVKAALHKANLIRAGRVE